MRNELYNYYKNSLLLYNWDTKDHDQIRVAWELAYEAHNGQLRASGEPYITHPMAVSVKLASLGADLPTICAGLLHDTLEDTSLTAQTLKQKLGREVCFLVEGVTKLDSISEKTRDGRTAGTLKKLLVASTEDIRVLVLKLADRFHNITTLEYLPEEKRRRIAQETLEVYAPLAGMLGMNRLKSEMEDRSFAALEPDLYAQVQTFVDQKNYKRSGTIDYVESQVYAILQNLCGKDDKVDGVRTKTVYSVYKKMVSRQVEFEDIKDLIAGRILTENCYELLGKVHEALPPIEGTFRDYIARPKPNGYQSLHTTVLYKDIPIEIQIRTPAQHLNAEYGIAAHWRYKHDYGNPKIPAETLDISDPTEFLQGLKEQLTAREITVYTPTNQPVVLPEGATTLDFAYHVHTSLGNTAVGAKINGVVCKLSQPVYNGCTVEIIAGTDPTWSTDRLNMVTTHRSQLAIRKKLKDQRPSESRIDKGKQKIQKAAEGMPLGWQKSVTWPTLAWSLGYHTPEELYESVAAGNIKAEVVVKKASRQIFGSKGAAQTKNGKLVELASCCGPIPGDNIAGVYDDGRKVAHKVGCKNLKGRKFEVYWPKGGAGKVKISLTALDRPGLLADVSAVLTSTGLTIIDHEGQTRQLVATLSFILEMGDSSHTEYVVKNVQEVPGVYSVSTEPVR